MTAWTTPPTYVVNELMTAALMNAQLRDNLNFLWAAKVCRLRASASISTANNTEKTLTWDTEDYDSDAFHSLATQTSRITIPAGLAGVYMLGVKLSFAAWGGAPAAGAFAKCALAVNGTDIETGGVFPVNAAASTFPQLSVPYALNVGDYVEATATQNSGGALNVVGGIGASVFWAARLGG